MSVPLLLLSSLVMYEQLLEETAILPAAGRECRCHKINVGAAGADRNYMENVAGKHTVICESIKNSKHAS